MRDIACSFRKSRLLPFLLLSALSLAQCRAEDLWGIPEAQVVERLARGDASFLRGVQGGELGQAFRLGPGSPYYLSFWAQELGDAAQARALLVLQWEKGRGRWKEEAALALLAGHAARGEWSEMETQARRFLPSLRSPELRRAGERALAEALYWQRKDVELLPWLDRLAGGAGPAGGADEELVLFRAASACRLNAAGWPDLFRELFFGHRASELHPRALSFLQLEERLARFSPAEAAFFQAKASLAAGRAAEALEPIEHSLPALSPAWRAPLLPEAAAAFLQAGESARGARLLSPLVEDSTGAEWAGRLARRAGDNAAAEAFFRRVVRESAAAAQRDRACWQLLDLARQRSAGDFLTELESQAWSEPSVFADLLEQEISAMVARRQWGELGRLGSALERVRAPGARARLAWLEGRLRELGLRPGDPGESFREAARLDPGGYHGRLSAARLPAGERGDYGAASPPAEENGEGEPAEGKAEMPAEAPAEGTAGGTAGQDAQADRAPAAARAVARTAAPDAFLLGFIEHGLYQAGYRRLLSPRASPALLLGAARELAGRGQYLLCLRLLARYLEEDPASEEVLRLNYPRGFAREVEEACRAEGLSPVVFFALVREESHFDPGIVSSAGAVGLTQLLPETAQEVGRLLRIAEPDLRDPEQNLRIGARHLARLLRSRDLARALLAYNAGAGRLRTWERGAAGLPGDLLAEAVPFAETRRYLRKILVSAVHYGELYYGLAPADTVRLFYP